MHASAGNQFRRWPPASFREVAHALVNDRPNRRVVLLGDGSDAGLAAEIIGAAAGRITTALGWPLDEVRALMERASVFVGGDSGPMHIAATTDVPIVAIFGPTLPALWTPWRPAHLPLTIIEGGPLPCRPCDQRVCEPGDFRCLRSIGADRVIAAARQLLERRP
jgi:ADP-heptose:LPS heptosyltransferase